MQDKTNSPYIIGVVSDTHGKLRPAVLDVFRAKNVDLILHAGDITNQRILNELEIVAPVIAVRGNNDFPSEFTDSLPFVRRLTRNGVEIKMTHIPQEAQPFDADLVIVGHIHEPTINHLGKATLLNPGSATSPRRGSDPSVALVTIQPSAEFECEIISLLKN